MKTIKNNPVLYYLLQFTWGITMNIAGALTFLFLIIFRKKKVKRYQNNLYMVVGKKYWGGVNLGMFFLTDRSESGSTKMHESGHALQNAAFGPLFLFIVAIPSAIRYHYREWLRKKGKPITTGYYDIWFEGQANEWGYKYYVEPYISTEKIGG